MRALLVPLDGGEPVELLKDLTLVGRKEDCDLRLEHKSVSKLHCVIVKTDGMLFLRDLGSTNSTRVNGQRVRRSALMPNDQLTIANYKFKVQLGDDIDTGAAPDEYTQHLDAKEVVKLLQRAKAQQPEASGKPDEYDADPVSDDDSEVINQPVQQNPLPDVYPDDKAKKNK
jgi:pSer/pThr/pTyr-binding forkhead associated (FHA) protein